MILFTGEGIFCHKLGQPIFVGNFFCGISGILRQFQTDESGTLLDKSRIHDRSRSSQ